MISTEELSDIDRASNGISYEVSFNAETFLFETFFAFEFLPLNDGVSPIYDLF